MNIIYIILFALIGLTTSYKHKRLFGIESGSKEIQNATDIYTLGPNGLYQPINNFTIHEKNLFKCDEQDLLIRYYYEKTGERVYYFGYLRPLGKDHRVVPKQEVSDVCKVIRRYPINDQEFMVVIGGNLDVVDYDNSGWIIGRELLLHGYFGRFVLYAFGWYDEENDHIFFFQAALGLFTITQFICRALDIRVYVIYWTNRLLVKLNSIKSYFAIDPSSMAPMIIPPVANTPPVAQSTPLVSANNPPVVNFNPPVPTSNSPVTSYYTPIATNTPTVASCHQAGVIYHPDYVLQQRPPESMTYVLQQGPPETLNCAPTNARKRNLKKY